MIGRSVVNFTVFAVAHQRSDFPLKVKQQTNFLTMSKTIDWTHLLRNWLALFSLGMISTFCFVHRCHAEVSGVDVFIKACQHRGANATIISSGHIEFDEKEKDASYAIQRIYSEKELGEMLAAFDGDVKRRNASIQEMNEKRKKRADHGSETRGNILFRRKSATESYCKLILSRPNSEVSREFVFRGLQKYLAASLKDSVFWAFDQREITINDSMPFAEPKVYQWGRIQGFYADAATVALLGNSNHDNHVFPEKEIEQFKKIAGQNPEAFILVGEESYDKDAIAKVIEVKVKGRLLQRYWIDPSRGHVCPLVQIYNDKNGKILEEYKAMDYFLHEKSGLWFPKSYSYCSYNHNDGSVMIKKDFLIDTETFVLNQKISDNEFSLDVPENYYVSDERKKNKILYEAISNCSISLAKGGLDIEKIDCFRRIGVLSKKNTGSSLATFVRTILVIIGVLLILTGIYQKTRTKKQY